MPTIFLYRCKSIVVFDTSNHGLDECVKSMFARSHDSFLAPVARLIVHGRQVLAIDLHPCCILGLLLPLLVHLLLHPPFVLHQLGFLWINQIMIPEVLLVLVVKIIGSLAGGSGILIVARLVRTLLGMAL